MQNASNPLLAVVGIYETPPTFSSYKFLFNLLLDLAATEQFNQYTDDYRREYLHEFRQFSEMVFENEKQGRKSVN